jgi:hypothetical protein
MCSRARSTGLPSTNSLRNNGAGCSRTVTFAPHGPCPYGSSTVAAAQPESSNSGVRHPGCSVSATFQPGPVTSSRCPPGRSTSSRTSNPAGPSDRLVARTASTTGPWARPVTSARWPTFHTSVSSGTCSTSDPLTYNVKSSSAVATSRALAAPAGRSSRARNHRLRAGVVADQIHAADPKPIDVSAAPIHRACQGVPSSAVSHQLDVLHADGRPAPSHTRTRQW